MRTQIAIIGAGPAGSMAALLLARAGLGVTLIEQHRFPRDKVCGECLSALGIEVLERLGLRAGLERLAPIVLTRTMIHAGEGSSLSIELPRPMWGISRRVMDEFLLNAARDAGAIVLQPARCEAIGSDPPVAIRVRRLETNRVETIQADRIILADGKGALGENRPKATKDFGIKCHFENVDGPRDAIELFGCNGLYGGLAAVEAGRWNAAFSVPATRLRQHRGNVAALFDEIISENSALARRLADARRVTPWLAAPLPRFAVRTPSSSSVIPIGNAAAALEPIGGEGMGLALRSAELAVESIFGCSTESSDSSWNNVRRSLWRVRRPACRTVAQIVSRPPLAASITCIGSLMPRLGPPVLRLLGK